MRTVYPIGFLTRAPLAGLPFYALLLAGDRIWEPRRWPWFGVGRGSAFGVVPSLPCSSSGTTSPGSGRRWSPGYDLALSRLARGQAQAGLFSTVAQSAMNLEYLFLKVPS